MQNYVTIVYHCLSPFDDEHWTDTVIYAGPDKGQALAAIEACDINGHYRIQVWVDGKFEYEEEH